MVHCFNGVDSTLFRCESYKGTTCNRQESACKRSRRCDSRVVSGGSGRGGPAFAGPGYGPSPRKHTRSSSALIPHFIFHVNDSCELTVAQNGKSSAAPSGPHHSKSSALLDCSLRAIPGRDGVPQPVIRRVMSRSRARMQQIRPGT